MTTLAVTAIFSLMGGMPRILIAGMSFISFILAGTGLGICCKKGFLY
jgi:hypothetical protein